ncbi:MAG: GNAT family protein [Planctomycetota bacterium]
MLLRNPPPYRIETERLVVRPYGFADAEQLAEATARSRDHLLPWLPWALEEPQPVVTKIALVRRWRGQFDLDVDHVYGIFLADDRTLVGGSGLHNRIGPGAREIGYWCHVDHVRKGYVTEAVAALTRVGFEVCGLRKIEIRVQPGNEPSLRIPRKLGYVDTGVLRSLCPGTDAQTFHDAHVFSLLADEYAATPSAGATVRAFDGAGRVVLG